MNIYIDIYIFILTKYMTHYGSDRTHYARTGTHYARSGTYLTEKRVDCVWTFITRK